jgi:hypothetical protein
MGRGLLLRRYLINRGHLSRRAPQSSPTNAVLATLSGCCPPPKGRLSTCYSPVRRCTRGANPSFSLNLHVLGLPLTFALSQDQTLHLYCYLPPSRAVGVDDVSSDFIPTRCSLPEGEAQPGRGLPFGIKPITLLAIQFSKTDRSLARAGESSDFSETCQPLCNLQLSGFRRGPWPSREPVSTMFAEKGKGFFGFFSPVLSPGYNFSDTSRWAWKDLNFRPRAYQARALTS